MTKPNLVIYHQSCPDGLCSAWAAWKKLGDTADYLAAGYHTPMPSNDVFADRDLYLVDFSYPLAQLERLDKIANSITVLDHHQSAAQALAGSRHRQHIRQDWSGAHITWAFFHGGDSELPIIVRYVEDNDIWIHKLPQWEEVKIVGEMMDLNAKDAIQQWDAFAAKMESPAGLSEVKAQGAACLAYRNAIIKRAVHEPAFTFLDGHKVPCVNATNWQSEIGDILDKKHPFAVMWRMTKDGNFAYSLRSDKERGIDVSAIAEKFGGGGHRNAAGFSSNAPPMLVRS